MARGARGVAGAALWAALAAGECALVMVFAVVSGGGLVARDALSLSLNALSLPLDALSPPPLSLNALSLLSLSLDTLSLKCVRLLCLSFAALSACEALWLMAVSLRDADAGVSDV